MTTTDTRAANSTAAIEALLAREFRLRDDLVYLNHAAVAPWPWRTAEAVSRFAQENAQIGATRYPAWQQAEAAVREQCAWLVGAHAEDIGLLKNTSEALSVVAHGFPWTPGDNVVISDEEFPSNRIVWESLRPAGVEVRAVALDPARDPEATLLAACDRRTRLLSISSVQYASGLRVNLAKLGELCRGRGIAFCVDAIQSLGVFAHDVGAMNIDFLMGDAHKWLLGPEGIAVFYCSPAWRDRLELHQYGWHMVEGAGDFDRREWQVAASARRFECGSPNMLGVQALQASMSLLREIGVDHIERRVLERAEYLFGAVRRHAALELVTADAAHRYAGIVTFRHRQRTPAEVHARLRAHNVVCAARGGGIRFSPHYYTPIAQLDQAVAWAAE